MRKRKQRVRGKAFHKYQTLQTNKPQFGKSLLFERGETKHSGEAQ